MRIPQRPRKALLVFSYECIPDKTVWENKKYAGAEVHCFLDRDINNMQDLSEAETAAREFLSKCGWLIREQLEEPVWEKFPSRFRCLFSDVLTARRATMEIACLDGISFLAHTWQCDGTEPGENK